MNFLLICEQTKAPTAKVTKMLENIKKVAKVLDNNIKL